MGPGASSQGAAGHSSPARLYFCVTSHGGHGGLPVGKGPRRARERAAHRSAGEWRVDSRQIVHCGMGRGNAAAHVAERGKGDRSTRGMSLQLCPQPRRKARGSILPHSDSDVLPSLPVSLSKGGTCHPDPFRLLPVILTALHACTLCRKKHNLLL